MEDFRKLMTLRSDSTPTYQSWLRFIIGNAIVSVQASSHHYCTPRLTYPTAEMYSHFEVAVIPHDDGVVYPGGRVPWFHPESDPLYFTGCDEMIRRYEARSWEPYDDGIDTLRVTAVNPVCGWAPASEVQRLLENIEWVEKALVMVECDD